MLQAGKKGLAASGSSEAGNGGALYLGFWAAGVELTNTTFIKNTAGGSGGAVHALAVLGVLHLVNTNASGNHIQSSAHQALLASKHSGGERTQAAGGAVYMTGSQSSLKLDGGAFVGNWAADGGAVAQMAADGQLYIRGPAVFRMNSAKNTGGAVSAGADVYVVMKGTEFSNNTAAARESAGGAFYCARCSQVILQACNFSSNNAAYGGGGALLQTTTPSEVFNCTFTGNKAVPSSVPPMGAVAALPSIGNATLDDAAYLGGGGLYLSLSNNITIKGSTFSSNEGASGGEKLERSAANTAQCRLAFLVLCLMWTLVISSMVLVSAA